MSPEDSRLFHQAKRLRSIDRSVPRSGAMKSARVDLGLALLELVAKPGVALTQEDIALWCGCCTGAIYLLEKRALRQLRNKIFFGKSKAIREELIA